VDLDLELLEAKSVYRRPGLQGTATT